jgi:hypothetical protein
VSGARVRPHPAVQARRRQVSRARGRRRRSTALIVLGTATVAVVLYWLLTGPLLAVHGVTVRGYDRDDRGELVAALRAAAADGTVLSPPVGDLREAAEAFPWVASISVARSWPREIAIDVVQAEPAAAAATREGAVIVTASGRVLGPVPEAAGVGWLRIGEDGPPPAIGEMLPADARPALAFVVAAEPEVAARVRQLKVGEDGLLTGRLRAGPSLLLGRPERVQAKARALGLVLDDLSAEDELAAGYIDLTIPERPALGPP